jgi:protein-L-isoaspartate(D-aspartate) O-methyltransferase
MTGTGRAWRAAFLALLLLDAAPWARGGDDADLAGPRRQMLSDIVDTVQRTRAYIGRQRLAPRVMDAMARVPRHEFVPAEFRGLAYANRPLPIGHGQTISQPYIVALMTELADLQPDDVVLEIGTGSGYQAAVLAMLVKQVYTIEIIPELGRRAEADLRRLGYANVQVRVGDGYHGWPEHAPFDAILVTAAPESIPPPLLDQLRPGGRLVVPVGPPGETQSLKLLRRNSAGNLEAEDVLPVGFVPLTRER